MNRLIRRDVHDKKKVLGDFDVAAPSVDVRDMPESGDKVISSYH